MSTPSSGRGGRKPSKMIVLKVPGTILARFPHDKSPSKAGAGTAAGAPKASPSPSSPSALGKESPLPAEGNPDNDNNDEVKTETPNDGSSSLQVPADGKKRGGSRPSGGASGGAKRGVGADGLPKPRNKPGPKRRKMDSMNAAEEAGKPWSAMAPPGAAKLGPKANQGAINAGLRALDRSGAPCRRWAKRPFTVKSFTGIVWELPTWSAPKREEEKEEENGEGEGENENGDNDNNPAPESSIVGSEAPTKEVNGATDSPAPMVEAAA